MIKSILISSFFVASITSANSAIDYVQFYGTGDLSGTVDGITFTNQDWLLEYAFENTVVDADASANSGQYLNALVGGSLRIGDTVYALGGDSITGNITLSYFNDSSNLGGIKIEPTSGGQASFVTSASAINPVLFTNQNDLSSVIFGTTQHNGSAANQFQYTSLLTFQSFNGRFRHLYGANGEEINTSLQSSGGSGDFNASFSDVSVVPEPSSAILGSMGCLLAMARRRRKTNRS